MGCMNVKLYLAIYWVLAVFECSSSPINIFIFVQNLFLLQKTLYSTCTACFFPPSNLKPFACSIAVYSVLIA